MKVLHLCLANFYIDNYSYQENMLTKFHKVIGLEVEIIASLVSFNKDGEKCLLEKGTTYKNEHGITVTRLEYKSNLLSKRFRMYEKTYETIVKSNPDIIFIHGCQFIDIRNAIKYVKKNPHVKIYVDNHADFLNSAKNFISKNILHKLVWKKCAQLIEPYTEKFYGVLPARVDFLTDFYNLPKNKVDLLVMGADDEKVEEVIQKKYNNNIRKQIGIDKEDFLIVTGGKIDKNKSQTLLLMKAINKIENPRVKLLVFGSVVPEYKEEFVKLLSNKVNYVGWIDSEDTYEYFNEADLVVFPGLHSVFWEQATGLGKPCVFRYMEGFTHVDLGGNCKFLYKDSIDEIEKIINEIVDNNESFEYMKNIAATKGMDVFSYEEIARRSIS